MKTNREETPYGWLAKQKGGTIDEYFAKVRKFSKMLRKYQKDEKARSNTNI